MGRIEKSIELLIEQILDESLMSCIKGTALDHAIQSGGPFESEGPFEIEMVETEHPQVACDVFEAETEEHACMISLADLKVYTCSSE